MQRLAIVLLIALAAVFVQGAKAQDAGMEQNIFQAMGRDGKAVVVAVHHGTADAAEQNKLQLLNEAIRSLYPSVEFREAWLSRSDLRQANSRGVRIIPTLDELLTNLKRDGYTHVLVQTSLLDDGIEMQYEQALADKASTDFRQIRIGAPLLRSEEDYSEMAMATAAAYGQEKMANIILCRGDEDRVSACCAMLECELRKQNFKNWYAVTTEGYPSVDDLATVLRNNKQKKVNIIPFIFTADESVSLQAARELAGSLRKEGFKAIAPERTSPDFDKAMIGIFKKHIKDAENVRYYNAIEMMMQQR